MFLSDWYLVVSLAVRGTFYGRCVVVDRARCLAVYEGRRDGQSVRRGLLRRGKISGCGITPPPFYAICTVTEVTELSFPPQGGVQGGAPATPSRRGRYTAAHEIRALYRHCGD
jgi:hypothetical protein